MAPLILIEHPLSPYAQKVRILLREKALPFEARLPAGLGSGETADDLRRVNPRLEVPALQVGPHTLFDSTIILEYLEETYPEPALMPAEPIERARARMIEEVCDTHWEAINWALGEIRFFRRGGDAFGPKLREAAERDVAHMHRWLTTQLGGNEWLAGDRFGWADLVALPFATMSALFGVQPESGTPLAGWLERGRTRPAVAQTVAEALATVPAMADVAALLDSGTFRRQFRDHRLEWMIRAGGIQVVLDGLARNDIRFTDLALFAEG